MPLQEEEHPIEPQSPPAGPAEVLLDDGAAETCAAEIRRHGGVEVFFVGRTGEGGRIVSVSAEAFGSAETVPAPFNRAKPGDVILHNHPSGFLEPSEADLSIAARAGMLGVGFYIIDNRASRCRVVVRPSAPVDRKEVGEGEIEEIFRPGGRLSRALGPAYESREQQLEMAKAVTRALNGDGVAVVEAGTGTGKSLAYLVPAVLYALRNNDKVVVSTHTKTLQEQLFEKDIPDLRRMLGVEVKAALMKGRGNYACQRKAEWAGEHQQDLFSRENLGPFGRLRQWVEETRTGDRGELPFAIDDALWEEVQSDGDNCNPQRCKFFNPCFFYESRRRGAEAQVLVVNHALLLADLYIRQQTGRWGETVLLPPFRRVVVDEAHNLERVAGDSLSTRITRLGVQRIVSRLYRKDQRGGTKPLGVVPSLGSILSGKIDDPGLRDELQPVVLEMELRLRQTVDEARSAVEAAFRDLPDELLDLTRTPHPKGREEARIRLPDSLYESPEWNNGPGGILRELTAQLQELQDTAEELYEQTGEVFGNWSSRLSKNEKLDNEVQGVMGDWAAMLRRLDRALKAIRAFQRPDSSACRWARVHERKPMRGRGSAFLQPSGLRIELASAPLDVSSFLRDILHARTRSAVYTSATLTVDKEFQFFRERVGLPPPGEQTIAPGQQESTQEEGGKPAEEELPPAEPRPVEYLMLESPFLYRERVFFGLPASMPPRDDAIANFVSAAIRVSGGRALVLFTSYGMLNRVHRLCRDQLADTSISLYAQGTDSRTRLLNRFREEETSVLFATSSFWEGVDVPGRSLELLIIAKLPFDVPDEPLVAAQCEYLTKCGRDPFHNLSVPRAVIRFKQGFGRLIRSAEDFGAILAVDDRLYSKSYGRRFIHSLPDLPLMRAPEGKLLGRMEGFLREQRSRLP